MINNGIESGLTAMYKEEGFLCPLCTDVFDQDAKERKPIMLTCAQHSICQSCFDEYKQMNLDKCPTCRKAIALKEPIVNSTVISAMDTAKKFFLRLNSAAPKQIDHIKEILVPQKFECVALCEYKFRQQDVAKEIEKIIPNVVTAMNWRDEEAEIRSEFNSTKSEWLLFVDKATNTPKGFTHLVNPKGKEFEIHWTGTVEKNQDLYVDFFKHLLKHVENQRSQTRTDWKDVSLSISFSSVNEHDYHRRIAGLLLDCNMHYDSVRIVRNWGAQRKLTVYPCEGPHNQPKNELQPDERKGLELTLPDTSLMRPLINLVLSHETLNLTQIFKLLTVNYRNPEQATNEMVKQFITAPENYFVYCIDGKAAGFVKFVRKNQENLAVLNCHLLPNHQAYADHFLEQFVYWAKTNQSMGKMLSAKEVYFPNVDLFPPVIQRAINRAVGF